MIEIQPKNIIQNHEIWFLFAAILIVTNVLTLCFIGSDNLDIAYLFYEDRLFESLSAVFYGVSAAVFLWGFFKQSNPRKYWCLFFAVLLFFVGGEEISWGQRIFDIATPETLESVNVQGEFNLHNIDGIHQNIRLFGVSFVLLFCFLIPISNFLIPRLHKLYQSWGIPICPVSTMLSVLVAVVCMIIPRLFGISGHEEFVIDEAGEFILSFGWIPFAIFNALYPFGKKLAAVDQW